MKRILGSLLPLIFLGLSRLSAQQPEIPAPYTFGEELNFEVSYGWLNLADAKMLVSRETLENNDKPHYKIDVFGKTKGAATIFGKVNDNWGTYVDMDTKLPTLAYRHIEEGKYRKHELVYFDQNQQTATMELYDRDNKRLKETKEFDLPGQVQDLVSGFYFLRTQDLRNLNEGESVAIRGFFDKEIYNIKLIYEGTEKIETNLGVKETYIFSPQLPKNKLFRGEYPVKVWVTKDENKIPVKIQAKLFIGSLDLDIVSAKGLKNY
ncbi:DUF3108 domain-containing protein [Algoriphagus halophytocola]|uniref:DUF3108 domain-containing protein n=1 Tax=Algoriphagus halophytocola TaxID=2991499 RepID=A0ABY6MLP2_9BACT|nr:MULTISPECIES: DUF3108 domain-containing protein [unclassified Algoriphagus]UZD24573.1 DUF3108 domain-containing protein [Algoriphagus sp. TR-M5]WBL41938.1 DUF3108 domain-containing protein [Algoriphagus sp. TR-M9]